MRTLRPRCVGGRNAHLTPQFHAREKKRLGEQKPNAGHRQNVAPPKHAINPPRPIALAAVKLPVSMDQPVINPAWIKAVALQRWLNEPRMGERQCNYQRKCDQEEQVF